MKKKEILELLNNYDNEDKDIVIVNSIIEVDLTKEWYTNEIERCATSLTAMNLPPIEKEE